MKWHKCDICFTQKYCSDGEFRNHQEDCAYKNGKPVTQIAADPAPRGCPKCGGEVKQSGVTRYCAKCCVIIGGKGGSIVLQ